MEIRSQDGRVVIIDAGSGIRGLGNLLLGEGRSSYDILFTHSHWDHILGFPFFKPIYLDTTRIDIHGCVKRQGHMAKLLSAIMSPPHFPVPFKEVKADIRFHDSACDEFLIGPLRVRTIGLSHPNMGLGFRIEEQGRSFVFLTDNELGHRHRGGLDFADYLDFCRGADVLFHDAEYSPQEYESKRGWGHSNCLDALRLAREAQVERFGLYHHNQDRDDAGVDALVDLCRRESGPSGPECFGVTQGMEMQLEAGG